jgi:hypothetical protein
LLKATLGRHSNLLEYFFVVTHKWVLSEALNFGVFESFDQQGL